MMDDKHFSDLKKQLNQAYGVEDDDVLDDRNKPLGFMRKALQLRRDNQKSMLASQEACDMIVVNAMMTLELPYVRERYQAFLKQSNHQELGPSVYGRLYMDVLFREIREKFLRKVNGYSMYHSEVDR